MQPTAIPSSKFKQGAFVPTHEAALSRLESFTAKAAGDYREKRNFDFGSNRHEYVSQLSPYIRNGLLSQETVVSSVLKKYSFKQAESFLQEVFWRTYWKGYLDNRPYLWINYTTDLAALRNSQLDTKDTFYDKATSSRTGILCFDEWCRELKETGYLHNHARMWFASIWIFTLKLPWQLGADFFLRHLLDGDPASNTCSWRWVAGLHTKGKTYLARSDNIARYTDNRVPDTQGLAGDAPPIEETHPHHPPVLRVQPDPPQRLESKQGLIILDEDLRRHIAEIAPNTPVLGLHLDSSCSHIHFSDTVKTFRKNALIDTLRALEKDTSCNTHFASSSTAAAVIRWANENNVASVQLAHPQVGPWHDSWLPIETALKQHKITISTFRPWWENALFPYATAGFFKFKKHIESVAQKMAAKN